MKMRSVKRWAAAAAVTGHILLFGCMMSADKDADMANGGFELWCGDHACAWKVEEGEVGPVPTWHRSATAIGFMSDPTVISQVAALDEEADCLNVSALGEVEAGASLYFEVDFYNDGLDETEPSIRLDDMDWKTLYRETSVPDGCLKARIILRKEGKGSAALAEIRLSSNYYCADNGTPPATSSSDCDADGGDCP